MKTVTAKWREAWTAKHPSTDRVRWVLYEGLPGEEWTAWLNQRVAEGWQWRCLKSLRQLDGGRFIGEVMLERQE